MKELLIKTLETFNYPVILQGTLSKDEPYPESFFTFWNNDSADDECYDNKENAYIWDFDVNFYSTDPEKTYAVLRDARIRLKKEKWIIPGKGYDVKSDEITHTGRGMRVYYLES